MPACIVEPGAAPTGSTDSLVTFAAMRETANAWVSRRPRRMIEMSAARTSSPYDHTWMTACTAIWSPRDVARRVRRVGAGARGGAERAPGGVAHAGGLPSRGRGRRMDLGRRRSPADRPAPPAGQGGPQVPGVPTRGAIGRGAGPVGHRV